MDLSLENILFWLALGLVMGFVARAILPGEQKMGLISTILIGAIGAFVGGFAADKLGFAVAGEGLNLVSLIAAAIGALVVLVVWCLIFKRSWK